MTKEEKPRKTKRDDEYLADKISGAIAKRRFKTADPEALDDSISSDSDDEHGRLAHLQGVEVARKRRFFTEEDELGSGKYQGMKVSREQVFANQDDFLDHLERELENEQGSNDEDASELSETDSTLAVPLNEDAEGEDLAAELRALTAERQQTLQLMQKADRGEDEDRRRGEQVRNQIKLWDVTCEWRMNLQPLLLAANRLPRGMANLEVPGELMEACERVMQLSLRLSQHLAKHDGITKKPSDSQSPWAQLCKLDGKLDGWLEVELEHWHKRANPLLGGKGGPVTLRAINQGPFHQVSRALEADGERILRKYRRTGVENYEDLEFYNHLLRDWLDRHQAQALGNANLTHLVSQIQRGKSANASHEHERASKGRKLRFDVQEKLVNYTVPVGKGPEDWTDDRIDELFRSLLQ